MRSVLSLVVRHGYGNRFNLLTSVENDDMAVGSVYSTGTRTVTDMGNSHMRCQNLRKPAKYTPLSLKYRETNSDQKLADGQTTNKHTNKDTN